MKITFQKRKFNVKRIWCFSNPFFSDRTRKKKKIKGIVIHNTGNKNDTAIANANYFKNVIQTKKVYAGAHFIIDKQGVIVQCGRLKDNCNSVGGSKYYKTNPKFYNILTNYNTVSIELCDIVDSEPSKKQIESLKAVIHYIQKHCKNATTICRHYDINGKPCPKRYVDNEKWEKFLKKIL